ncbi:MAG: DUF4202 domain-containing protein [Acidimicrobiia bacterium]|nr:DUF4202 domain-containing protein [Acidimicrobiia bacterium]
MPAGAAAGATTTTAPTEEDTGLAPASRVWLSVAALLVVGAGVGVLTLFYFWHTRPEPALADEDRDEADERARVGAGAPAASPADPVPARQMPIVRARAPETSRPAAGDRTGAGRPEDPLAVLAELLGDPEPADGEPSTPEDGGGGRSANRCASRPMAEGFDVGTMMLAVPRACSGGEGPASAAGGRRGAHQLHRAGQDRLPGLRHHRRRRGVGRGRRAGAPGRPAAAREPGERVGHVVDRARLEDVIAAIDEANADDPNTLVVDGVERPKEQAHAELMTEWVRRLDPDAEPAQLIAARAHRLRRWSVPRSSYPEGRKGYLRWRADLKRQHAREVGEILERFEVDAGTVERVQGIVRKEGLKTDPRVQTHEDALCLVFLRTQYDDLIEDQGEEKATEIVGKTLAKMSERGREAALGLDLGGRERAVLDRALEEA